MDNSTVVDGVIYGADKIITQWVMARTSVKPLPDATALGIMVSCRVKVGVIYDRWNGANMEITIAAEKGTKGLRPSRMAALFAYPFITCGAQRLTALIDECNPRSLVLCENMGFEREAVLKRAAHDFGDVLVMRMFRNDCPWIRLNGKELDASPPA